MADDPPAYRPRRAFADEPTTQGPTTPAEPEQPEQPEQRQAGDGSALAGRFTEDEARPIFRESAHDADAATVRTPAAETSEPEARTSRLNFTPRARPTDAESTTLLPRTAARDGRNGPAARSSFGAGEGDVDDLEDRPHRLSHRTRLTLLVAAVAVVVVVGIAIGAAVIGGRQPTTAGDPSTGTSTASTTPSAAALLDEASMLAPEGAQAIDTKLTWTAGATVRGAVPDGGGAACLGSDPLEGAPTAQQTISRTLTASGNDAPTALHLAQGYASAEDATQAFAVASRALGTCAVTGDWLSNGRAITGVGDESVAAGVTSLADGQQTLHWVVLSRTGRALDVLDASTPGKRALNVNDVTKALATVVGAQCSAAGGTCPTTVSTTDAPPPPGGDEPGFLATGDLPPAGPATAPWVGTPVEAPSEDFTGSQCESVNWATTAATTKSSRVYLLQDVPGIFGLNEIVLTEKDAGTASKLTDKIRGDWTSCKERKLTATVDTPTKVTGVAADGSAVTGWTTEIEQKAGSTTTRFRVGIASSGDKVAFVFLNPQKGLDVDGDDWNYVAVRAVQRLTQQS